MGEQAKPLLPFLQRGDELQRADPKVAYYCRMFACEEGMRTSDKTPEMRELLSLLVLQLEKTKPSAGLQGAEEDEAYVENFALRLFAKADKLDRGGRRDAKTAKLFYVASIVIETLRQFDVSNGAKHELSDEMAGKQRYAAWRAGELAKANREGRTAAPPPEEGEDESASAARTTGGGGTAGGGGGTAGGGGEEATTTTTTTQAFADGVSAAHVADAQKHAKYAVSALGFEDVPTAIDNLNKALALLTGVRGLREP
ncbi:uncharacterized protein MICPUCDRAFT_37521 [Micromonas pusilla CCMP1545]|uniref:Predicted protein n=1 Tax=Micromonas pusilla (strain CCMP1545) TaxID=564608 RepID=C1MYE2_MICPC|nr:uncharacterized protein MICPUCDRAFT_37521 [Micromonas pusilla CCMP1545]EEH55038.1 predicted protein [Micromonas pusilla CCMP1545]|eukprot:XP_003060269.1 predicted protein [Micromonas pusilla CCMP1545]